MRCQMALGVMLGLAAWAVSGTPTAAFGDRGGESPFGGLAGIYAGGMVLVAPKYEGSDDYRVIGVPLVMPDFGNDTGSFGSRIQFRGPDDVRFRLIDQYGFEAGPVAGYRFGRDEDDSETLRGLGDVDGSIVLGGFAAYRFGALRAFASSGRVWLICGSIGFLTVQVQAFTDFLPLYLQNSLGLPDGHAGMASAAFPLGCLISTLAGGFVYDGLSPQQKRDWLTVMLLGSVACVLALWALPSWSLGAGGALGVSMGLLLVYGGLIAPAYYLPMGIFAIEFGGPHCGILIGLIDAAGYLVAAAFPWLAGWVAQEHGWGAFLLLLAGVAFASAVLMRAFTEVDMRAGAGVLDTSG